MRALFDLRLRTAQLELRLPSDDELFELAQRAPADLETDPAWPGPVDTFVLQWFWRALGTWKTEQWRLPLAVWINGSPSPVGFQELEAENFAVLRTVESSSWLVHEVRGRGLGKEMRAAVLALAFDGLGAEVATSGAWDTNEASLGVSAALGYVDNGWQRHERPGEGEAGVMRRVVLERGNWDGARWPTTIEGLDGCRSWFGGASAPGS